MPYEDPITKANQWFAGADKVLQFTVYVAASTDAAVKAGTATAQNITGWTLGWYLSARGSTAVLISETSAGGGVAITDAANGVYQVTIADTKTNDLAGSDSPLYRYQTRRLDAGSEDVIAHGDVVLLAGIGL